MEQATLAMPSSSGGAEDALRSTPGRANFQRISRLIVSGGTRLLRETFDSNCKPSDLPLKLKDPAVEKALNKARLTKPQRDCLYPSPGVYGKSTDFDITLLFKLFRNMGFLSPPSTGWEDPPNITDHSLTADILRLKFKRNSVAHVNENMEIANDDFPGLWSEISEILLRIAGKISVAKRDEWQKAIKMFSNEPLTPEHERCVDELLRWYRNDLDVKKSLEEVKASLGRVEESVNQMERKMAGVSQPLQGRVQSVEAAVQSETQDIKKDRIGQGALVRLHINLCEAIAGIAADSDRSQVEETSQQDQDESLEEALTPNKVGQSQATDASVTPKRKRSCPSEQEVLRVVVRQGLSSPSTFLRYLRDERKVLVVEIELGSLLITVECVSLQILEELWEDYRIGHLNAMVQELLVTSEVLKELGLSEVKLKTTILEEEYKSCREYFLSSSGNMATPLCLPNNYTWDPRTRECSESGAERSSLYVVEDACQILRAIKGPVCVVSIAGPYRKGKSFALSEVFDQPGVFPLGSTMDAKTVGIWIWVVPEKYKDPNNGQELTVVLLDSEGTDGTEGEDSEEHRIFTLNVLLASVLIYNSSVVPTRKDVESLDFISKLSERIQFHSDSGRRPGATSAHQDEAKFLHQTFPFFIWLLRDVALYLPEDCKDLKDYFVKKVFKDRDSSSAGQSKKVAVSILRFFPGFDAFQLPHPTVDPELLRNINENKSELNPLFLAGIEKFKCLLGPKLVPKQGFNDGEFVTGEGLASLLEQYVEVINTPGMIPNVQNAWDRFVSTKCSEARRSGLKAYYAIMTSQLSSRVPCDNETIRQSHESALKEGMDLFEAETVGISVTERYLAELTKSAKISLDSWMAKNADATKEACQNLLEQLKEKHLQPILAELHSGKGENVCTEDIVNGYNKIIQDYKDRAVGAKDVRAAILLDFEPKLMKQMAEDVSLSEKLKEFDENMIKEKLARALQEKETKRVEEERARLQQNNRDLEQELKMVCLKNEQELKRNREQMEATLKNNEKQMENMKAALMKETEEERKVFMQENNAWKERMLEMQQQNAESKRKIIHMSELITKHEDDRKRAQLQQAQDEEIRKKKARQEEAEEIRKKRAQEAQDEEIRREQKRAQKAQDEERERERKFRDGQKKELDELRKLIEESATSRGTSCAAFGTGSQDFYDREEEELVAITDRVTTIESTLDDLCTNTTKYVQVRSPSFFEAAVKGVGNVVSAVVGGVASAVGNVVGAGAELVHDVVTKCSVM